MLIMNLTNASLILVLSCAIFIVVCSILHKIQIFPSTKGVLCVLMIGIIGVLSGGLHPYTAPAWDFVIIGLAAFFFRMTVVSYKRGFM